jgi:hypothetical protein
MAGARGRYLKNLAEWVNPPSDDVACYVQVRNSWSAAHEPVPDKPWLPEEAKQPEPRPARGFKVSPGATLVRRLGTVPAPAYIESVSGRKARCLVQVAGAELPVEIPFRILEARGLKVGMRFMWWMSEDGSVTVDDIDDMPPNRLTAAEEAEAQRLYTSFRNRIASGNAWGMDPAQDR